MSATETLARVLKLVQQGLEHEEQYEDGCNWLVLEYCEKMLDAYNKEYGEAN